jgi:hypothetical protein
MGLNPCGHGMRPVTAWAMAVHSCSLDSYSHDILKSHSNRTGLYYGRKFNRSTPPTSLKLLKTSRFSIFYSIPLQSSDCSVYRNVAADNHMIAFASNKHFGLADTGHRSLEGNTVGGREGHAVSAFVPTIGDTSFCGLIVVLQCMKRSMNESETFCFCWLFCASSCHWLPCCHLFIDELNTIKVLCN